MTESTAKKARRAIKSGECKNTQELINKFNLSNKDANRCEQVVLGREFMKGRIKLG